MAKESRRVMDNIAKDEQYAKTSRDLIHKRHVAARKLIKKGISNKELNSKMAVLEKDDAKQLVNYRKQQSEWSRNIRAKRQYERGNRSLMMRLRKSKKVKRTSPAPFKDTTFEPHKKDCNAEEYGEEAGMS